MILEGIIKKTQQGIFAVVGNHEIVIRPHPDRKEYSDLYKSLKKGDRVFIDAAKGQANLIIDFNSGQGDYFFQRMFGNIIPEEKDMNNYQKRIASALDRPKGYQD